MFIWPVAVSHYAIESIEIYGIMCIFLYLVRLPLIKHLMMKITLNLF